MTRAFHEIYLRKAMINLGDMFDYAINDFGLAREDFAGMFAYSAICSRLENGEPKYLIGMSGAELALDVIEETTGIVPVAEDSPKYDRTPDYWCGWVLCYYHWLRNIQYKEIFKIASYDEVIAMYPTLHEADVSKFADVMDERRRQKRPETNLRRVRTAYGCSQNELARMSGVSLRSIQMYEQRNKDINRGQAGTVLMLARALGCRMEDLLEAEAERV